MADLTVRILEQIRDGISSMHQDFDKRLDKTNMRLERVDERLERVELGLNDLGGFMRQIARDQAK